MLYWKCKKKAGGGRDDTVRKETENLLTGMADAGCTAEEIKGAERLLEADRFEELTMPCGPA